MIDEDISAGRTCFPLKDIYEETCQRKRHFGDDTDVNRTRLKDIVLERFPVLKEEIGCRREGMLVLASAMKNLVKHRYTATHHMTTEHWRKQLSYVAEK